jgi:hemin uptake protein HemP
VTLNASETDRAKASVGADAACTAPARGLPVSKPDMSSVNSSDLLRGRHELLIHHGEEVYRLRLTGRGKLILTK